MKSVNLIRCLCGSLLIIFFFVVINTHILYGQDSNSAFIWNGYVKELSQFSLPVGETLFSQTHLIHNRINLKWRPEGNWSGGIEVRNRIFIGDAVEKDSLFRLSLRPIQDLVDLSKIWYKGHRTAMHSNMERMWIGYDRARWSFRLGRQRINWGMVNSWNPNDIFNAYNLLDFDYEERAGADAFKVQYRIGELSRIEAAVAAAADRSATMAIKYVMNRNAFDWQFIAGWYVGRFTGGVGWAGHIGKAGFKGEAQLFVQQKKENVNVTVEVDYLSEKGWYWQGALLYGQSGTTKSLQRGFGMDFKVSPDRLMPTRWNLLAGVGKEITPLLRFNMSMIGVPFTNWLIVFPSVNYNIATNLDLGVFWQGFLAETDSGFGSVAHAGFFRMKWSF